MITIHTPEELLFFFFFQAEDGIRDAQESRGLGDVYKRQVNILIMVLILVSTVATVTESTPGLHRKQEALWFSIESFCTVIFTIEFITRLSCCPACGQFWRGWMNYIDLFSILPYYLELFVSYDGGSLAILRLVRVFRAVRFVKVSRYSSGVQLIGESLKKSTDTLKLFMILLGLGLVVCSSGIYYTERGEWDDEKRRYIRTNPLTGDEQVSPFQSIPRSLWWGIVTMFTVGYGDAESGVPVTYIGQVVGACTGLCGIMFVMALPISVIGANFIQTRAAMLEAKARRAEKLGKEESFVLSVGQRGKDLFDGLDNSEKDAVRNERRVTDYCERAQSTVVEMCAENHKLLTHVTQCLVLLTKQREIFDAVDETGCVVMPSNAVKTLGEWMGEVAGSVVTIRALVPEPGSSLQLKRRLPAKKFSESSRGDGGDGIERAEGTSRPDESQEGRDSGSASPRMKDDPNAPNAIGRDTTGHEDIGDCPSPTVTSDPVASPPSPVC
eukprot:TRINITY_DN9692_c0_g1_i1.p1 TRINITY_DN9692_c0_g1~~TRINITY_DN9692_c0_g1_i1.p1  ORF type:complete len:498 (-),score=107.05 TRINITY_DN9692_c0_g1_i1:35-1528(-)